MTRTLILAALAWTAAYVCSASAQQQPPSLQQQCPINTTKVSGVFVCHDDHSAGGSGVLLSPASAAQRGAGADSTRLAVAGEWTRCVAWSGGLTFNIVNGQGSQAACFALGRKCTGNPNSTVTYYGSAVIVHAPYQPSVAF